MARFSAKDIILFNPWDNRFNLLGRGLSKEEIIKLFNQTFFLELNEFKREKQLLENRITPFSDNFKHFSIISGYSGNGKTTFINWFQSYIKKEKNGFFKVINLISEAHGYNQSKGLIISSIHKDLTVMLRNSSAIELIIEHKEEFYTYYSTNWNSIVKFHQTIKGSSLDIEDIVTLINSLSFQQILLLYCEI
jgi:hypothetical protein